MLNHLAADRPPDSLRADRRFVLRGIWAEDQEFLTAYAATALFTTGIAS